MHIQISVYWSVCFSYPRLVREKKIEKEKKTPRQIPFSNKKILFEKYLQVYFQKRETGKVPPGMSVCLRCFFVEFMSSVSYIRNKLLLVDCGYLYPDLNIESLIVLCYWLSPLRK